MRSKFEATVFNWCTSFLSAWCWLGQPFLRYDQQCLILKKHIQNFGEKKSAKKQQSPTDFLQNLTRTPAFWDTPPPRPMITHTSGSHQIPSQNKTKSKFCKRLYMRHTSWSCLIRCINMKWSNQNRRHYRADAGQMDGRTEWNQYTPQQLCCVWGIMR